MRRDPLCVRVAEARGYPPLACTNDPLRRQSARVAATVRPALLSNRAKATPPTLPLHRVPARGSNGEGAAMTYHAEGTRSIGSELERRRLTHRADRIRHALAAMRQLAGHHGDGLPAPLRHGITDYGRDLGRVERRLRELDRDRSIGAREAAV